METLKSARLRNIPWDDVARAVRQLEAEPDSSGLPPIRRAEQLSGYSANQLRRMIAGLAFLDDLARTDPEAADWLSVPKFSHAEMLAKLWRRDQEATLRLLKSKPVLRYESLSKFFESMSAQTASPMSAGKRAQKSFEQKCLSVLLDSTAPMAPFGAGSYQVLRPRVHHPYCRPALLVRAATYADRVQWAGLDFVARPVWEDATLRQIMVIGVEARFLDLHFIFFPEGDAAGLAYRAIQDLGLGNIRIAVLSGQVMDFGPVQDAAYSYEQRRHWVPPRLSTKVAEYEVSK